MIGIFVNQTRHVPYAEAIVRGYKTIETRTRDMLGRFVGERVLIIATGKGIKPEVVGSVVIRGKRFYTADELDTLRDVTLIPPGSRFDCRGRGKWGYAMADPEVLDRPVPLSEYTITHRTRSFMICKEA